MDEKDTLGKMFMDMSDANQWARQVMNPTGFVSSDGKFQDVDHWTSMIDEVQEHVDALGWSNKDIEYKTLYNDRYSGSGIDNLINYHSDLENGSNTGNSGKPLDITRASGLPSLFASSIT